MMNEKLALAGVLALADMFGPPAPIPIEERSKKRSKSRAEAHKRSPTWHDKKLRKAKLRRQAKKRAR